MGPGSGNALGRGSYACRWGAMGAHGAKGCLVDRTLVDGVPMGAHGAKAPKTMVTLVRPSARLLVILARLLVRHGNSS